MNMNMNMNVNGNNDKENMSTNPNLKRDQTGNDFQVDSPLKKNRMIQPSNYLANGNHAGNPISVFTGFAHRPSSNAPQTSNLHNNNNNNNGFGAHRVEQGVGHVNKALPVNRIGTGYPTGLNHGNRIPLHDVINNNNNNNPNHNKFMARF